jgi:hypothetical protein
MPKVNWTKIVGDILREREKDREKSIQKVEEFLKKQKYKNFDFRECELPE